MGWPSRSDDPEETFDILIKRVPSTGSKFGVNPSKMCRDTTHHLFGGSAAVFDGCTGQTVSKI